MDWMPSFDERTSPEDKLRLMDEAVEKQRKDIEERQAVLLELKYRRNDFAPISCLPPEVLCKIFSFAQAQKPNSNGRAPPSHELKWIRLTYVCRLWRDIALAAPSLWLNLPIDNLIWTTEMLKRSHGSDGLVVDTLFANLKRKPELKLALQHAHRIKDLSIKNITSGAWKTLRQMLPGSAPQLQRLCLWGEQYSHFSVPIPNDILCETRQLRHLELRNWSINWNTHPLLRCSLTHLKLSRLSPNSMPTGEQLLETLKNLPELWVLELDILYETAPQHSKSQWQSENVHLAHLRKLHLDSLLFSDFEYWFLQHVTFPPTATVHVGFRELDQENYLDFSSAISGLTRSYSDADSGVSFQTLVLRQVPEYKNFNGGFGAQLQFFTKSIRDVQSDMPPNLQIAVYCPSLAILSKFMDDMFKCDYTTIHSIRAAMIFGTISGVIPAVIANTLGNLPQLVTVLVDEPAARPFFDALVYLNPDVVNETGSQQHATYFPVLNLIHMFKITFDKSAIQQNLHQDAQTSGINQPVNPSESANSFKSINLLQDFLTQRRELGRAINKLFFKGCHGVSKEDKILLREVVAVVKSYY